MSKYRKIWALVLLLVVLLTASYSIYVASPALNFYLSASWIVLVIVLLWLGNKFITDQFNRYFPWLAYGSIRFFSHLFLGIIYSLIVINLAYFLFKILFTVGLPTVEQVIVMNVYGTIIFIPFFSIYFSLHFLKHWQRSSLAIEKYKKENIQSQLAALKNHLDPHFLFNNLNILSSLIDKDRNRSRVFLDRFAAVYRGILKSKDEDLIPLRDEINFMESYIYLLKTRFEEHIKFNINIDDKFTNLVIPPLTVQMLVENAIKHNIISEKKALCIEISVLENGYLIVKNSLNSKPEDENLKSGSGLNNIKKRYEHFTGKSIKIDKSEDNFIVQVPLLELESV